MTSRPDAEIKELVAAGHRQDEIFISMARGEEFVVPGGGTTLQAGDTLLILADKEQCNRLQLQINAKE